MAAATQTFKYVSIPCDVNQPIVELSLDYTEESIVSCFIDSCKAHFASRSKAADANEKKAQNIMEQFKEKGQNVTADIVQRFSALTFVGNISLLTGKNTAEDGTHVAMYVDDNGQANGYPNNFRAQQIVAEVRASHTGPVWGDAFIASFFDDNDNFRRLDFTMGDLSSSSEWFGKAQERNTKNKGNTQKNLQALQESMKTSPNAGAFILQDSVIVNGLKSKPQYNGLVGMVSGAYLKKKDRWPVTLENGVVLSVRTCNLSKNMSELMGEGVTEVSI